MLGKIVFILSGLALVRTQIPSLGWCPEYVPMANFNMDRFLGVWYEAERYFQLSEVVARCVMANYTKGLDGKFRVSNEVTNRFTGIKRVLDGEIKPAASKAEEGKLHVKYSTIPLSPETQYSVLETDYDTYAVLWSCSGIGPVHTQNAWLMTRERLAPGSILQKAYGVLDKYKISKTFFVKTDQDDCAYLAAKPETVTSGSKPEEGSEVTEPAKGETEKKKKIKPTPEKLPDPSEIVVQKKRVASSEKSPNSLSPQIKASNEPAKPVVEEVVEELEPIVPETVPKLIAKMADRATEIVQDTKIEKEIEDTKGVGEISALEKNLEEPKETPTLN